MSRLIDIFKSQFINSLSRRSGLILILLLGIASLDAATVTTTGSGNWNSTVPNAPWPGGTVPALGDNVIIASGHTVTLSAAITKSSGSTVTISQNGKLVLNQALTIPSSSTATELTVDGTLEINSTDALKQSGNNSNVIVGVTGSITVNTLAANSSTTVKSWAFDQNSSIKLGISGNQTLDANFGNSVPILLLSGSGTKSLAANVTVQTQLVLSETATFSNGGFTLSYATSAGLKYSTTNSAISGNEWLSPFTATGGVTIANTNGTVSIGQTKTLSAGAPLIINSGATFNSNDNALTFGGNFINNGGAFNAGSSNITIAYNSPSQSIAGFTTTGSITFSKNAGTASFSGNLSCKDLNFSGTGSTLNLGTALSHSINGNVNLSSQTLDGSTSTINVGGNWTESGGVFIAGGSSIIFNGTTASSQINSNSSLYNLTVNNTFGVILQKDLSINGGTTLTNGRLSLGNYNLSMAEGANFYGSFSANNMVVINGTGRLRKYVSSNTSVLFPIGEATGTAEYTPITVTMNSGNYALGAYISAKVTNSKHINNPSTDNYINRYWSIEQNGITSPSYSVNAHYMTTDIVGNESKLTSALYTGISPWLTYTAMSNNTLTANNAISFGDFSGLSAGTITLNKTTITDLHYTEGFGPGNEDSIQISGNELSENVTIIPSASYEISTTSGSGFNSANLVLTKSGNSILPTTVYIRLKSGLSGGIYNEVLQIYSSGAKGKTVTCQGYVLNQPTITTSTNSITSFSYPVGYGPSNIISFTVNGSNLQNNIVASIPADANFELSNSIDFSNPANTLLISAVSGAVSNYAVYVRMKAGLAQGVIASQNITLNTDYGVNKAVSCSGNVVNAATITFNPTSISSFSYVYSSSSSAIQSFSISATNLVANAPITLTPSANFEISTLGGTSFNPTSSITLNHTGTTLSATTIYVRMKLGLGVGTQTGEITASSTSCPNFVMPLSGTVTGIPTIITSTSSLSAFLYTLNNGPSEPQSFTVTGTNLGGNIIVTPPTSAFEIKLSTSSTYSSSAITIVKSGTNANATINVRLKANLPAAVYGPTNVNLSTSNGVNKAVALKGEVVNSATIALSKTTLSGFGYLEGDINPSSEQSFVVSGTGLNSDLTITPPSNYEIYSTATNSFQTEAITISRNGTTVIPTPIKVRLAAKLPHGNYGTKDTPLLINLNSNVSAEVKCIGKVFTSPLITASGGGSFCQGETITLQSFGSEIIKQYWEGPNQYYSNEQNPTLTTNATTNLNGTYTVTGNVYVGGNLITNGDFEAGNTSFSSSYTYVSPGKSSNTNGNLWSESTYTVDSNPNASHTNFSSCVDKTSGSGKQMIINGSSTAGVVVWSQSVPVLPNQNYEFSYYLQSVVNQSPSKLQLYVNGVPAGPVYSALLNTCEWKQFVYNTNSGSATYANLELINQNTLSSGNDFALDEIVFQQILYGTVTTQVTVTQSAPVSVVITASANPAYLNAPVTFTANTTNGGTNPTYQWKLVRAGTTINVGTNNSTYTTSELITSDSVYCIVTSNVSCPSGNPAISNKICINLLTRSNYWIGSTSSNWGTPANWTNNSVPLAGDDVEYATLANNNGAAAIRDLQLDIDRTIGNLINATDKSLIIPAGKSLTVNNSISTDGNPNRIYIYSSTSGSNGTLIYHNPTNFPVNASVEMYSKAWINTTGGQGQKYNWQYFGIPLRSIVAFPSFNGSYVREWHETGSTISNHWVSLTNSATLNSFIGYELCQNAPKTFIFRGTLENGNYNSGALAVTYGKSGVTNALFPGQHIFANPYTAAIDIRQLSFGSGMLKTVFIYNTGTYDQWTQGGTTPASGNNLAPGQYTSVPYNLAGIGQLPRQIPSMQAIVVKTLSPTAEVPTATFGMNYNSATLQKNNIAQRVMTSEEEKDNSSFCMLEVNGKNASDRLWLFIQDGCTAKFDNGWDGEKIIGKNNLLSPQIYTIENDANYQVDTRADFDEVNLGLLPGNEATYTITATHQNLKHMYAGLYLVDMFENKVIDITQSGTSYQFATDTTILTNRFKFITRAYEQHSNEAEKLIRVFTSGSSIFIQNTSKSKGNLYLFDINGQILKSIKVLPETVSTVNTDLTPGPYVVKVVCGSENISKRLIIK